MSITYLIKFYDEKVLRILCFKYKVSRYFYFKKKSNIL